MSASMHASVRTGLALLAALPRIAPAQRTSPDPSRTRAWFAVDHRDRTLVVTAGPFRLPVASMEMSEMSHAMMDDETLPVAGFEWPFDTWVRGATLELVDAQGRPLPRQLVHHFTIENFDRRDLVYPVAERLMSMGRETQDVSLPRTVGVPMKAGQHLGLWVMWSNTTGREIDSVFLRLTLRWTSPHQLPRPVAVLPFHVDANMHIGGHNTFDLPPGGVVRSYEFTLPVAGHLLAVSGHLHDHGLSLRLEDAESGKTVVTVTARRDSAGGVVGVSRELLAIRGEGPHLRAQHRYRLAVRYDNPTADTIRDVMGIMAGLFAPDHIDDWPPLDVADPSYVADRVLYSPEVLPAAANGTPPVVVAASASHAFWRPVVLGSLGVLLTGFADQQIRLEMRERGPETQETGTQISHWSPPVAIGIGAGILAIGVGARSPALARTGRDALVAMGAAGLLTATAKIAFGRARPNAGRGTDSFEPFGSLTDDNSFPSGHTSQAFALAAVLAAHARSPVLRVTAYGAAAAVGIARVAADRHFASDVVAGAILGTVVGRRVVHHFDARGAQVGLTPIIGPGRIGFAVSRPF